PAAAAVSRADFIAAKKEPAIPAELEPADPRNAAIHAEVETLLVVVGPADRDMALLVAAGVYPASGVKCHVGQTGTITSRLLHLDVRQTQRRNRFGAQLVC